MIDPKIDPLFSKNPFFLKDEEWKEKRAEISPAFTNNRLKALYPIVEEVTEKLLQYTRLHSEPLEARELSAKFTVDVVSNAIYGIDVGSFQTEKPEVREMGRQLISPDSFTLFKMFLLSSIPYLKKYMSITFTKPEVQGFFTNLMQQALEYREKSKDFKREDFLDYIINLKKKKHISDIEMASHTISFFTDGFETSSVSIAHNIYEVSKFLTKKIHFFTPSRIAHPDKWLTNFIITRYNHIFSKTRIL